MSPDIAFLALEPADHEDLLLLAKWLRLDDDVPGRVSLAEAPTAEGEMGGLAQEVQVVLTSGTVSSLITAVVAWLRQRDDKRRVSLTVRSGEGQDEVSFTVGSADDVTATCEHARRLLDALAAARTRRRLTDPR